MNATERLRALLDERGVEWEDDSPVPSMKQWKTSFMSFTGEEVALSCYDEPKWIMGTLVFHTPEQAVEATLGHSSICTNSERTSDELLPCPFCGGEAEVFQDGWHNADTGEDEGVYWCVWCSRCGAVVRGYEEADAIAAWNRRAE